jgi:GNAT superfamily N-acetyltransferase
MLFGAMHSSIRAATPGELTTVVALDDDACQLYAQVGLALAFPADHPFAVAERASWRRSLELGRAFLAVGDDGTPLGFAALDMIDGAPYLEQLSVRLDSMRRGLGRALLARAIDWARAHGDALWLNTYDHLPWNRPFYEKEGFVVVTAAEWGAGMAALVEDQRQVLPAPERRVVMRRRF